jgi:hypothetical protein
MQHIDSSITHIRPRFKLIVAQSQDKVMANIREMLAKKPAHIQGHIIDHHVILDIVGEEVHYWSPQLNFRIEKDEDKLEQTIVAGLIGPRPGVWTLFVFIYFAIALAGFVLFSIGMSKWLLGGYSHMIWALPVAVLAMLSAYRVGKYGESLAEQQTEILKGFVREAIKH